MDTVMLHILQWLAGPNTGLSSEAMAYFRIGVKRSGSWTGKEHPCDPADFNRCLLLVETVPAVRDAFGDIAKLSPQWKAIIDHWDELRDLFVSEAGWNWSLSGRAAKTYDRMKQLFAEIVSDERTHTTTP